MLNARLVTTLVLLLFVTAMVVSLVMIWVPPSDSRLAIDSYSGRTVGNRALYELLDALRIPVSRNESTPQALYGKRARVLMVQPDLIRVETEKAYLEKLARWVHSGGQLVVVSDTLDKLRDRSDPCGCPSRIERFMGKDRFLARLGITRLAVARSLNDEPDPEAGEKKAGNENQESFEEGEPEEGEAGGEERLERESEEDAEPSVVADSVPSERQSPIAPLPAARRFLKRSLTSFQFPAAEYDTRATGTMHELAQRVRTLYLPETPSFFRGESVSRAVGAFEVNLGGDTWRPIALGFRHGGGEVTLASELSLFSNVGLGKADNAVLAYHLAAGRGDREVVVDEYYHGFVSRGNWIRLLGYPTYAVIALCILMASVLWAWRHGVRFGPPAPGKPPSRRSILEYVDAMARLFQRGRKYHFVLHTCREGLIADLTGELFFAPGAPEPAVLSRLAQLDAERASRVRKVLKAVDQRLASRGKISRMALVKLQEKLDSCRKTNDRNSRGARR
jgi:hypothetical protein